MKNLLVFLALLLVVTPNVFAGQVASKDTVNGWYFLEAKGELQDTTWTHLTSSAISGQSSQVFGLRSYGPTEYFWAKKLSRKYPAPYGFGYRLLLDTVTTKRSDNFFWFSVFLGNSDSLSSLSKVINFPFSNLVQKDFIDGRTKVENFKGDSLDVIIIRLSFNSPMESAEARMAIDNFYLLYLDGSTVPIEDGGEPKFPQFKTAKPKINFGPVAKNSRKLDSVLVTNTGDAPLVLSKLWTDDSSFSVHCSTTTIAPQSSTNVVVEFAQDSLPGLKRAKLYVEHNASGKMDSIELVADFATSVGGKNTSPKEFSLGQNYPNPFNPSTKISYSVKSRQWVKLTVYDLLGKEVAVLVDGEQEVGDYITQFNARNLSSGTYIYRFQAGNFVATKKMMLVK